MRQRGVVLVHGESAALRHARCPSYLALDAAVVDGLAPAASLGRGLPADRTHPLLGLVVALARWRRWRAMCQHARGASERASERARDLQDSGAGIDVQFEGNFCPGTFRAAEIERDAASNLLIGGGFT